MNVVNFQTYFPLIFGMSWFDGDMFVSIMQVKLMIKNSWIATRWVSIAEGVVLCTPTSLFFTLSATRIYDILWWHHWWNHISRSFKRLIDIIKGFGTFFVALPISSVFRVALLIDLREVFEDLALLCSVFLVCCPILKIF